MKLTCALTALAALSVIGDSATACEINVPGDWPTIQEAIDAAADGCKIWVEAGTYHELIDLQGKAIEICSVWGRDVTIIDGDLLGTVVTIASGEGNQTILSGFTIRRGMAQGGGMRIDGSSPMIRDCIFTENIGIDDAAGMFVTNGSNPQVIGCRFVDNVSPADGAGMYIIDSSALIVDTFFVGNQVTAGGNRAGGAILNSNSDPTIVNCVFQGNATTPGGTSHGGAIANSNGSEPLLVNCTFYQNSAATYGSCVDADTSSHVTMVNCIVWDNDGGSGLDVVDAGSSITVFDSCVQGGWAGPGDRVIDLDPQFLNVPGNLRLSMISPCIDAGDSSALPAGVFTDIGGLGRFIDDPNTPDTGQPIGLSLVTVDMGAYEYQFVECPFDRDGDGQVTVVDLLLLLASWGDC